MSLVAKLQEALSTFDRTSLGWAAQGFAAEGLVKDPESFSQLLATLDDNVADLDTALRACGSLGPFAPYAVACLAKHGGLGRDEKHAGALLETRAAYAGNLVVEGAIALTSDDWLLVAGDVEADALIVSCDVIIAGKLTARRGIIGLNSWSQSMWVKGPVQTPAFVAEDYAVESDEEPIELGSEEAETLLAPGLAEKLREWQGNGGPNDAIEKLKKLVARGEPIFRGK